MATNQQTEMPVIVDIAEFRDAINFASFPIERRNTIPILGLVRLIHETGKLQLNGTNLDIETETFITCGPGSNFSVMVPPRFIKSFLYGETGSLGLSVSDGNLVMICDTKRAEIPLDIPSLEYPRFSKYKTFDEASEDDSTFYFSADEIHGILKVVSVAISTEETRYYLNGVYLTDHDDALDIVVTDGHRLALHRSEPRKIGVSGIIPAETVRQILAYTKKGGYSTVTLNIIGGAIKVEIGGQGVIYSKLIDGSYPDYTRAIPEYPEPKFNIRLRKSDLSRVVLGRGGAMTLDPEAGLITSGAPYEPRVEINIEKGIGSPIGLNGRYTKSFLDMVGDATIHGNTPGDPIKILPDEGDFTLVQMPMRI